MIRADYPRGSRQRETMYCFARWRSGLSRAQETTVPTDSVPANGAGTLRCFGWRWTGIGATATAMRAVGATGGEAYQG